jgi:thiamine pyrophosphate-dependent acetolactate synthase large subunit-like protein
MWPRPNTLLLDNALATMGAGLPSAIAAKLVFPSRAVVAIAGDGGFMMNSQELETAMRLKLNLVVIILLDEHYGMVQRKQRNRNLSEFGLAFGNPDFVKYAEAYQFFQHVELDGAMTARGTTPAKNNAIKIRVASNARMISTRLALTFGRGAFSRAAPANSARCRYEK